MRLRETVRRVTGFSLTAFQAKRGMKQLKRIRKEILQLKRKAPAQAESKIKQLEEKKGRPLYLMGCGPKPRRGGKKK